MKNLLALLLCVTFLCACPKPNSSEGPLDGSWNMESYVAFLPEQPQISEGDIVWTFNSVTNELKVLNNIEAQYSFIQGSGTYDFSISNDLKVSFDGRTYDYRFESSKLIISDKPELDGPMMTFVKVN